MSFVSDIHVEKRSLSDNQVKNLSNGCVSACIDLGSEQEMILSLQERGRRKKRAKECICLILSLMLVNR